MEVLGMIAAWIVIVAFFGFVAYLLCIGAGMLMVELHEHQRRK